MRRIAREGLGGGGREERRVRAREVVCGCWTVRRRAIAEAAVGGTLRAFAAREAGRGVDEGAADVRRDEELAVSPSF